MKNNFKDIKEKIKNNKINTYLTIDVGYNTGFCYYNLSKDYFYNKFEDKTISYGMFTHKPFFTNKLLKLKDLGNTFKSLFRSNNYYNDEHIDAVILEGVCYYPGSQKSEMALKRGDLINLSYLTGVYFAIAIQFVDTYIISAQEWKGNMNDEAVRRRVERKIGETFLKKNECHKIDAIGMALSLVGKFGA